MMAMWVDICVRPWQSYSYIADRASCQATSIYQCDGSLSKPFVIVVMPFFIVESLCYGDNAFFYCGKSLLLRKVFFIVGKQTLLLAYKYSATHFTAFFVTLFFHLFTLSAQATPSIAPFPIFFYLSFIILSPHRPLPAVRYPYTPSR
ncbi:hypothetical protein BC939DRAFT_330964 [Gamsiella multidivaricata]|uniref:uncharacterized protein n=1 Tax=Gamsiella multidivaricata TaxID=101098 RepID=UPI002220A3EF|nr:uncharacterized protein BC939DRAFT_330964 [Gamsiella multidivaricata]KAI7817408.1 hypothetical protein BC939DRAFT_330964 [Gamsiella multidivaricata]